MRHKILKKVATWHADRPWTMLAIVTIVTLIMIVLASQLTMTMQVKDLLPEGDPKVEQFELIRDEFATSSNIVIVVQGEEARIKKFADELAPKLLQCHDGTNDEKLRNEIASLREKIHRLEQKGKKRKIIASLEAKIKDLEKRINIQFFQRVDYKAEMDFLRKHGLLLAKAEDLQNTAELFTDPNLTQVLTNLNNSMEREYVGKQESISSRQKEDEAVQFLDGIEYFIGTLTQAGQKGSLPKEMTHEAVDQLLLGDPYFISYDNSTLIMEAIPNFTIMDRDLIASSTQAVGTLVEHQLQDYPDVQAGLTGSIAREYDEQTHAQESIQFTTIIAFIAIFIMLILAFRMWIAPVLAMFNLVIGLIWAMGVAYLARGELNMVTSMMSIILLGLGIDFSIHMISSFTEWRAAGHDIKTSMQNTFLKTGKGIVTGALTTACAFLTLIISRSEGMESMGIVTGLGLLAILMATMFFLPILLVFRARIKDRKISTHPQKKFAQRDISLQSLGRASEWFGKKYIFSIAASVLLTLFMIWSAFQIEYDRNYMNMEPKGLTSIALMDTIQEKFDLSMEYALCLSNSVEESRELSEKYRDLSLVAMADDISTYLPSEKEQQVRIPYINDIRKQMSNVPVRSAVQPGEYDKLVRQIERLEMNIIEIQDMAFLGGQDKVDKKCGEIVGFPNKPNSENKISRLLEIMETDESTVINGFTNFQRYFSPYFKKTVLDMSATDIIQLKDLPASILDRYSNRKRDKFLITIYPKGNIYSDADMLVSFADQVDRINPKTTGGPQLGVAMLRIFAQDGRNAVLLTIAIVFLLLWVDFSRPGRALIAMIPLAMGAVWMIGLMYLVGMKFTFMNFLAIPLIIGIGIDDGVHIMHRWLSEGKTNLRIVFASTGKAILLTSLTTMLAFGSMHFSVFPAWAWFGEGLFIGVGACFLTTVLFMTGILGWLEHRRLKKRTLQK